jgi:opacity protein-like surface antigen
MKLITTTFFVLAGWSQLGAQSKLDIARNEIIEGYQKQSDCSQALIQAERSYYAGRFTEVESLLSGCIANGFDKEQITEAYKLIALSKIFSRNFEHADSALRLMLTSNPLYKFAPQDPPEFKKRIEKINVIPRYSINLMAGSLIPTVNVKQVYSIRNLPSDVNYKTSLGYQFGLSGSMAFTKKIFVEVGYEWQSFSFSVNKKNSLVETRMDEKQKRTQITLGGGYNLRFRNIKFQVLGGANFNTLKSATCSYYYLQQIIETLGQGGIFYREKLNFSNLPSRKKNDLRPFVMLRVGLPQRKSVGISLFARYELGTANHSANKLYNLTEVLQLEKVEDDFKVSFLSFGVVVGKTFFKVK